MAQVGGRLRVYSQLEHAKQVAGDQGDQKGGYQAFQQGFFPCQADCLFKFRTSYLTHHSDFDIRPRYIITIIGRLSSPAQLTGHFTHTSSR